MTVKIFGNCILFSFGGDNRLVLRALSDIGTEGSPGPIFHCMPLVFPRILGKFLHKESATVTETLTISELGSGTQTSNYCNN